MGTEKVSYRSAGKEADLDFDARVADDFTLMRPGFGGNSGCAARADILQWDQVGSPGIGRSL